METILSILSLVWVFVVIYFFGMDLLYFLNEFNPISAFILATVILLGPGALVVIYYAQKKTICPKCNKRNAFKEVGHSETYETFKTYRDHDENGNVTGASVSDEVVTRTRWVADHKVCKYCGYER